jgi:hypothetical protein
VPGFIALLEGDAQSGRYSASEVADSSRGGMSLEVA